MFHSCLLTKCTADNNCLGQNYAGNSIYIRQDLQKRTHNHSVCSNKMADEEINAGKVIIFPPKTTVGLCPPVLLFLRG